MQAIILSIKFSESHERKKNMKVGSRLWEEDSFQRKRDSIIGKEWNRYSLYEYMKWSKHENNGKDTQSIITYLQSTRLYPRMDK